MSFSLSTRPVLAFALALTAAACSNTPPPQSAAGMGEHQTNVGGTNLLVKSNLNQGFCFDAEGDKATNGTSVNLSQCHGRENQRWVFSDQADGQIQITGIGGLCLDVKGHQPGDGKPLQLLQCANSANQKFRHEDDGRIREVESGKCLTVADLKNGAPLTVDECSKANGGQVWVISK
jgi:hypothetical protein